MALIWFPKEKPLSVRQPLPLNVSPNNGVGIVSGVRGNGFLVSEDGSFVFTEDHRIKFFITLAFPKFM